MSRCLVYKRTTQSFGSLCKAGKSTDTPNHEIGLRKEPDKSHDFGEDGDERYTRRKRTRNPYKWENLSCYLRLCVTHFPTLYKGFYGHRKRKTQFAPDVDCTAMDSHEARQILILLRKVPTSKMTPQLRRLKHKIAYRLYELKSSRDKLLRTANPLLGTRYCMQYSDDKWSVDRLDETLVGLVTQMKLSRIECTYTERILPPLIKVGTKETPLRVRMFVELSNKVRAKSPHLDVPRYRVEEVKFYYLQAEHIPALNVLANTYFWSFIDLETSLDFPEFSCIAMYKKVVVGFALMGPGQFTSEGYVNFLLVRDDWRRVGIAKFMLYHLIQTCFVWDNSLHSSVNNQAMTLYQKMGFKPELLEADFYDKYLSPDSQLSKTAFYSKIDRFDIC